MEEDIKKCEEFINLRFLYGKLSFTKTQLYEYQKAIKNLLTRYKQLEEKNEELRADNYELNNRITDLLENIPVQKVKEKIEELKEQLKRYGEYSKLGLLEKVNVDLIDARIEDLECLLGKE